MNIIIRHKNFNGYGLDISKNWLEAPVHCNAKCLLGLPDDSEEFWEGTFELLSDVDVARSAIFAHATDGTMKAMIKIGLGDDVKFYVHEDKNDIEMFKKLADAYNLDAYALVIQRASEEWEVIEE